VIYAGLIFFCNEITFITNTMFDTTLVRIPLSLVAYLKEIILFVQKGFDVHTPHEDSSQGSEKRKLPGEQALDREDM
jgi:hypothetical protein